MVPKGCSLSALRWGEERAVAREAVLHGLQQVLIHPARELAPVAVARATRLQPAAAARASPIVLDAAAEFEGGGAVGQRLPRGAAIGVGGRIVDEIVFGEAAARLIRRRERPRHQRGEAGVQTRLDLASVIVALVSHHHRHRPPKRLLRGRGHRTQLIPVARRVGHVLGDDEFVLGVDRGLHVVTDLDPPPAHHRPTVGIREGARGLAARRQFLLEGRARKLSCAPASHDATYQRPCCG